MKRVVITGIGWITPMGTEIEPVWKRLLAGESGIATTSLFDASTFPTSMAAEVKQFSIGDHIPASADHATAGRNTQFALAACSKAWKMAGLDATTLDLDRVGMYLAGGEGELDFDAFTNSALLSWDAEKSDVDMLKWAEVGGERMDALRELEQEPNMPLSHLALLTGARGPAMNCLTACAASTQAIGEATQILRRGDADVMIGGGTHSMVHPFGITGFNRLTALCEDAKLKAIIGVDDPTRASRPFDNQRAGFVLGEGAGIVILETLEHAQARGATILAEVAGYGSTADAFRITDQHPEGAGAIGAMQAALADAKMTPHDVQYINAHGTGTRENDGNESHAIKQVFGPKGEACPVSSIKSMMGHLIAAAGAVELIACILAIRDNVLPPTTNLQTADPECDLDYVPNVARKATVNAVLSNSFGFGGQNDSIIVKRYAGA